MSAYQVVLSCTLSMGAGQTLRESYYYRVISPGLREVCSTRDKNAADLIATLLTDHDQAEAEKAGETEEKPS